MLPLHFINQSWADTQSDQACPCSRGSPFVAVVCHSNQVHAHVVLIDVLQTIWRVLRALGRANSDVVL